MDVELVMLYNGDRFKEFTVLQVTAAGWFQSWLTEVITLFKCYVTIQSNNLSKEIITVTVFNWISDLY